MGQGLATWRVEGAEGREVGLPIQQKWALETRGPGFKPSSITFCCVSLDNCIPTSRRFNLEPSEPVLYCSWESFTRCCFRRTSSVLHTEGAQWISASLPSMTERTTRQSGFYSVPLESKTVHLKKLWCNLLG